MKKLTPVVDARDALRDGAPQIWPEAPGNLAVDWPGPHPDPAANAAEVERIFASAKYIARMAEMNQRLVVASMEPRGATASYDAASDAYLLRTCSQGAGAMRENVLAIMNWPKERLRVITEDVGGAFGLKTSAYPEYLALLVGGEENRAADPLDVGTLGSVPHRQSGARYLFAKPSSRSTRRENFWRCASATSPISAPISARSAPISRALTSRAACPACTTSSASISRPNASTPTPLPTAPYRGAGRPEANYVLERWSTRRRASPASIRSSCGGAI